MTVSETEVSQKVEILLWSYQARGKANEYQKSQIKNMGRFSMKVLKKYIFNTTQIVIVSFELKF